MAKWSDAPADLLIIIAERLTLIEDFVAFRSVCSSWRSTVPKKNFIGTTQLAYAVHARKVIGIPEPVIHHFKHRPPSSSVAASTTAAHNYKKRFFATKGWLFAINKHGDTCLFHPFSRVHVKLPHVSTLPEFDQKDLIRCAVLSKSPSFSSNYTLIIRYEEHVSSGLAYWKPGKDVFTELVDHQHPNKRLWWVSITCTNEQLYTMERSGTIVIWDIKIDIPVVQLVIEPLELLETPLFFTFLVELNGEVYIVGKARNTYTLLVHRIDVTQKMCHEVEHLETRSLFCGLRAGTCFFIEPSEVRECNRNCIYLDATQISHHIHRATHGTFILPDGPLHKLERPPKV